MKTTSNINSWKTTALVGMAACAMLAAALGCEGEIIGEPDQQRGEPTSMYEYDEPTPRSQRDILEGLGVDTDLGPRTGGNGQPLAANAHPLGSRIATLSRVAELVGIGLETPLADSAPSFILDEPATAATSLALEDAHASWTTLPIRDVAAGDIDGDGLEETLIAYLHEERGEITLRVIDDQNEAQNQVLTESSHVLLTNLGELSTAGYNPLGAPALDLAAADFDGDGADEIALAYGPAHTVFVFGADGQVQFEKNLHDGGSDSSAHVLRLEAGDPDGDGRDELVATDSRVGSTAVPIGSPDNHIHYKAPNANTISKYHLIEADEDEIAVSLSGRLMSEDDSVWLGNATATMGDFDGDRLPEIAFGGINVRQNPCGDTRSRRYTVLIAEDGRGMRDRTEATPYEIRKLTDGDVGCSLLGADILSGDFDGDLEDEILFDSRLYELNGDELVPAGSLAHLSGWAFWYRATTAVADFDGDKESLRDEVAVVAIDLNPATQFGNNTLQIIGQNDTDEYAVLQTSPAGPVLKTLSDSRTAPLLADVNLDNDSVVVEYTGETEIMFSKPHVVAALASAPYYEGMTHADGQTAWGESTETTQGEGQTTGFSTSLGVGVKIDAEAPFIGDLGFSASVMVTSTFSSDFENAWERAETQTIQYLNPAGQDLVIFSTVPYDFYYYTIAASPDADEVGEVFAIHVPRRAAIHHLDRAYYNAHNGDAEDVDESIMGHTIGDPWSYPTESQRDAMMNSSSQGYGLPAKSNQSATCSGSLAKVMLEVALSETTEVAYSGSVSIALETELEIGKFVKGMVTAGAETHVGYTYTMSSSRGISFSGTVGDMSLDDWAPELAFDWGVFAYFANAGDQSFPVVSYWVE